MVAFASATYYVDSIRQVAHHRPTRLRASATQYRRTSDVVAVDCLKAAETIGGT
jgi:hypothetical protein